ncbi:MAG TPA: VWA domain-containing protein [Candidatus Polarisedimenticolia bacterium]|nr:VWA domain-containing protein [Candidatus Polarisedimenticolia bacterium]
MRESGNNGIVMSLRTWLVPALLAASVAAAAPAGAPPSPTPPAAAAPAMVERAVVDLVLIEVYVTDSRGQPLRGLMRENFSLMVDGHQKPIHSLEFREISSQPSASPGPPDAGGGEERPATPATLPRRFVLFFEDSMSAHVGLTTARQAAEQFVETGLRPGDQVALASYDRKLRILHDFTTDRQALKKTIAASVEDLRRFTDFEAEQEQHQKELIDLIGPSSAPTAGPQEATGRQITVKALSYGNEYTPRFRAVLEALTSLVNALAPYPGHKSIVFMGDGVPEDPLADFVQQFTQLAAAPMNTLYGRFSLAQQVKKLADYAAGSEVTLHSIQTAGLNVHTGPQMRARYRRSNTLETLALNTGGTASTSNDILKALDQAEGASRAYYVIGYLPEGPPDGRHHSVQIRLKGKSGSVRWRRGFTRLLPEQARERTVEAAYLLPELYPDLGVEISMAPGPVDGQAQIYDLVIHVPPGRALFVPQPGGVMARLDAGFVMIDGAQREVLRTARQAVITLQGTAARLGFDFYSRIRVPRGGQTITAVVYDRAANVLGAARHEFPAAEPAPSEVLGLALYSLSENSLWVEIPATGAPPPAETAVSYEMGPALKTTFAVGEPVACGFRFKAAQTPGSLRLVIRDGPKELRGIDVLPRASGDEAPQPEGSFKVDLPVEGLPAGNYLLVIRRKETGGAELDAGTAPLRLRSTEVPGA